MMFLHRMDVAQEIIGYFSERHGMNINIFLLYEEEEQLKRSFKDGQVEGIGTCVGFLEDVFDFHVSGVVLWFFAVI